MKWIETNGLLVLEHGAHERVPSGIPEAVLRMGVVGGSEGGLASSPLRSQSALIPSLKPMATGDSDNRWSMPRAPALAEPEARPARRRGSRTDRLASRREEPPASHRFHRVLSAATAGTGAGQPEWDPAICTAIGLTFCEGGVARLAVAWPTTDAAISPHPRHAVARDSI
jgi:hypothetical protein